MTDRWLHIEIDVPIEGDVEDARAKVKKIVRLANSLGLVADINEEDTRGQ